MMNTIACGDLPHPTAAGDHSGRDHRRAPHGAFPCPEQAGAHKAHRRRPAALLAGVVAGGTGHEAALPGQTAAGKTGTAQTGQFSGGTELKNYWFAGFVPAEQPRYTIVVLQDTQAEPAFSSAAIFARVAAGLEILAP